MGDSLALGTAAQLSSKEANQRPIGVAVQGADHTCEDTSIQRTRSHTSIHRPDCPSRATPVVRGVRADGLEHCDADRSEVTDIDGGEVRAGMVIAVSVQQVPFGLSGRKKTIQRASWQSEAVAC